MPSSAKDINRRRDFRDTRFDGEFSCVLVPLNNQELKVFIRPIDVSARGLGFLSKEELKGGEFFLMTMGTDSKAFRVELAYCSSHLGIDGLFRCGLFLREQEGDLKAHCLNIGLLRLEMEQKE